MELQGKEEDKAENHIGKLIKWSPKIKCLLILDVKPFRSQVKGMHYAGKEVQSLAVLGKKLLTQRSLEHRVAIPQEQGEPIQPF